MSELHGRDEELRRLAAALEDARASRGRMLLLLGEPGIGKTRLCDELARIAEKSGARVVWGRCWESGFAPAYWPFTQVLRALASHADPAFADLGIVAPDVFRDAPRMGGDAREMRFQLFDTMARFLQRAAAEQPLVIFLDDLHAADEASLRMLQFALRTLQSSRILIIGTQRDVAMRTSSEVSAALHAIGRDAERIALRRLSIADTEQWIADEDPARASQLANSIHQATEGNPLFIAEVLRVTRARGASAAPRIPDEVRAVLAAHLELADEDTRGPLSVAALIGREFDEELLGEVLALSRDDVVDRLERAASVGLTIERGEGRHAFVHVLLRDELERSLSPSTRADYHFRIGQALASRADHASLVRAVHYLAKSGKEHTERMIEVAQHTAAVASKAFSFDDAMAVLDIAARQLPPGERRRLALELEATRAQIRAGEGDSGRLRASQLGERAKQLGDAELMAKAALVYGTELLGGQRDPTMVRMLEEALAALPEGPSSLRARVMSRLASALVPGEPETHVRAGAMAGEAIAMSQAFDDDCKYSVLQWAVPAIGFTVPSTERAPLARLLIEYAEKIEDPVGALRARHLSLIHAVEEGSVETALAALERTVNALNRPYYAWRIPLSRAIVALSEGRLAEADRQSRAMWDAGGDVGVKWVEPMFALMQMSLMFAWADPNIGFDVEERTHSIMRGNGLRAFFYASHAAMRGNIEEAKRFLAEAPQMPINAPLILPAGDAVWRAGNHEWARRILDTTLSAGEPLKNPFIWGPSGAMCGGPTALILARLAWMVGQLDEAIRLFELGLKQCGEKFPAHRAQIERDLGKVYLQRGETEKARLHLEKARELGARCGMDYFVANLPQSAVAAPVRERTTHVISLTREGDVWKLAALGETVTLEDRKGVHYLARLLNEPNRDIHVLDLLGVDEAGDAGAVLDQKAKNDYRARIESIKEELEEARRFGDRGRIEKYEAEMDAIAEQLARGVGLGGRDRKAASGAERARINVQRRIRDVIDRVSAHAPALGKWLNASIKTGTYCSYVPLAPG
jgi:tetratricopeptide (TPR) repeat protein